MRQGRRLLAAAAAGALALIAVVAAAVTGGGSRAVPGSNDLAGSTAATGARPALFAQAQGWRGGRIRPAAIYLGEGGAPLVRPVAWSQWTSGGAQGAGRLFMEKPGCTGPSYQCPYQHFTVTVTLSGARLHDGTRYWSQMRWAYPQNLEQRVITWRFLAGFWQSQ